MTGPLALDTTPGLSSQLGDVKPHVLASAQVIASHFGLSRMSGYRTNSVAKGSDHPKGLAIDIPANKSMGDQIAAWVTANAAALGVKYVIWQTAMWKPGAPTWTPMSKQGGDTGGSYDPNHLRHVHVSFTDTAPDASLFDKVRSGIGAVVGSITDTVGSAVDAINPLSGWASDALVLGLKIAAVLGGIGLVLLGANRLVQPAVMNQYQQVKELIP